MSRRSGRCSCRTPAKIAMQVQAAAFTPDMYSTVHHHARVEAIYVIDGEACYQTPTRAFTLRKGETLTIPGGTLHRAVAVGSSLRYVFAVIIYAAQPPTIVHDGAPPQLIACK